MSKIALQGDASGTGTFTIAAPNSNSNPTLTLPTSSGTVVVTGGAQTIEFAAGSAASPSITFTGDTNTGIFSPGADTIAFSEGGAEAMRIDSSGNVLVGTSTARTAWDNGTIGSNLLQVERSGSGLNTSISIANNGGTASDGSILYLGRTRGTTTGSTTIVASGDTLGKVSFQGSDGTEFVEAAAVSAAVDGTPGANDMPGRLIFSTTADGSASPTERMRIDSSGNVGIGTSSPAGKLAVDPGSVSGTRIDGLHLNKNLNAQANYVAWQQGSNGWRAGINYNDSDYPLCFFYGSSTPTASSPGTERARITSGGYFKASNNATYYNSTGSYHEMSSDSANNNNVIFTHQSSSPYGPWVRFSGGTPNNTTNYFLNGSDTTNDKFFIYSSGTISNRTGTYNSISDLKLKQDVVDANSQWDDIKALRIVKYRLKDEVAADPNYPAYIGVIAQEVEQVSPGLVDNCPDFENVTKTREVEKTREVTPAVLDDEGNEVTPAVTETYTETEEYTERVATGTVTKSVKSSIIYMKAVKALQEAMTRIEALEAEVAALKGQ